jgi:hypothetical protein
MRILGNPSVKLFLDDMRPLPPGYVHLATTADECIACLATESYGHVSLDHDLHRDHYAYQFDAAGGYNEAKRWDRAVLSVKTGYAVLEWMRAADLWPPEIQIHSLSTGVADMLAMLRAHAPKEVRVSRVQPHSLYPGAFDGRVP